MWNLNDALAFATGSAATAIDQAYSFDYPTLQDSIDSHRQNLVDTLVEYRAQIWEEEALQAFDDAIRAARRDLIVDAAALTDEDAAIMLASPARYTMHDYCSAENDRTMNILNRVIETFLFALGTYCVGLILVVVAHAL